MKIIKQNPALILSAILTFGFALAAVFYLMRERRHYSLETTLEENAIILTFIFFASIIALPLNLSSLYSSFSKRFSITTGIKIFLLNFPLLMLQCLLAFAWIYMQAIC
jgi:hypothetical protein